MVPGKTLSKMIYINYNNITMCRDDYNIVRQYVGIYVIYVNKLIPLGQVWGVCQHVYGWGVEYNINKRFRAEFLLGKQINEYQERDVVNCTHVLFDMVNIHL